MNWAIKIISKSLMTEFFFLFHEGVTTKGGYDKGFYGIMNDIQIAYLIRKSFKTLIPYWSSSKHNDSSCIKTPLSSSFIQFCVLISCLIRDLTCSKSRLSHSFLMSSIAHRFIIVISLIVWLHWGADILISGWLERAPAYFSISWMWVCNIF